MLIDHAVIVKIYLHVGVYWGLIPRTRPRLLPLLACLGLDAAAIAHLTSSLGSSAQASWGFLGGMLVRLYYILLLGVGVAGSIMIIGGSVLRVGVMIVTHFWVSMVVLWLMLVRKRCRMRASWLISVLLLGLSWVRRVIPFGLRSWLWGKLHSQPPFLGKGYVVLHVLGRFLCPFSLSCGSLAHPPLSIILQLISKYTSINLWRPQPQS